MSNTYRATSPAAVAAFAEGVFERAFSPSEEKDWLDSGLLELVPRKYKVVSNNYSGGAQGSEIEAALLVEIEAALVQGGHLKRVEPVAPEKGEPEADGPKPVAKKPAK
jgi:hypothetical protein